MRGLPSILSPVCNKFNEFNNTGAQMLDSVYHLTLKLFQNHFFGVKTLRFCHMCDVKAFPKICKPLVVNQF